MKIGHVEAKNCSFEVLEAVRYTDAPLFSLPSTPATYFSTC